MKTTKVFIWPECATIEPNNGIGRVVWAQHKYLPKLGIELVTDPARADVIACHTQQAGLPRVDVLHCHGLYWTGDPGSGHYNRWHHRANKEIIVAARRARRVTVPSSWVAETFKRNLRLIPDIIGHGLDLSEWTPGNPEGYVLWNKNRPGDVCDPTPPYLLASRKIAVVSTFVPEGTPSMESLTVVGFQPHDQMKDLIQRASVYLASVKETFGIGTLEAMASGVPILGYNWGGTSDLVEHEVNGYLVEPGDIDGLETGFKYILENRLRMSRAARHTAEKYDWLTAMKRYAVLYEEVADELEGDRNGVSVIVTNYNYAPFVGQAITSLLEQTHPVDEIIVVDDGSTDNSKEVLAHYADQVKVIYQDNQGVAAARNNGLRAATQPLIVCLDADDMLHPQYIKVCRDAMMADRGHGIVYTGLSLMDSEGKLTPNGWPPAFNWDHMTNVSNPPSSCIPSAAMFRRTMWEKTGGWRQAYAPGEDTEFWVHGLSLGYTAEQVAPDGLFWYRPHSGSASRTKTYKRIDFWHPWMRDKDYPMGAPANLIPKVRSHNHPQVSVIIPVGDGHVKYLPQAIESLLGQTFRNWEVIVVDATKNGDVYDADFMYSRFPFARLYQTGTGGNGPSLARNLGLYAAKAPLVLFLDADDYLHPHALEHMLFAYTQGNGRYVYTDWTAVDGGRQAHQTVFDYNNIDILTAPRHAITVLIDRNKARDVGFDETLERLEDWDFFARCAVKGYQGMRLKESLVYVRVDTGTRTRGVMAEGVQALAAIAAKYSDYAKGTTKMGSCCGGNGDALLAAKAAMGDHEARMALVEASTMAPDNNLVRMEFTGEQRGAMTYGGPGVTRSGQSYRGGNNAFERYINAAPEDVDWLQNTGDFKVVAKPSIETPPLGESVPEALVDPQMETLEEVTAAVMQTYAPPLPGLDWVEEPLAEPEVEKAVKALDLKPDEVKKRRGRPPKATT